MRIRIAIFGLIVAAAAVHAADDTVARQELNDIRLGRNTANQIRVLRVRDSVVLPAGAIDAADLGADSVAASEIASNAVGTAELAGMNVTTMTAVTNGQALTLIPWTVHYIKGVGNELNGTNVITVTTEFAASDVGKPIYIVNDFYATNDVEIDIDGNFYGGGNAILADGESAMLMPIATNKLYLIFCN